MLKKSELHSKMAALYNLSAPRDAMFLQQLLRKLHQQELSTIRKLARLFLPHASEYCRPPVKSSKIPRGDLSRLRYTVQSSKY